MVLTANLGRTLQAAPRTIYRASKYLLQRQGSYAPCTSRHFSHSNRPLAEHYITKSLNSPPKPRLFVRSLVDSVSGWRTDLEDRSAAVLYRKDGEVRSAHRSWLRDACTCERCVDPSSGQKRYASSEVPAELHIKGLDATRDGSLLVHWADDFFTHDTHVSKYPASLWQGAPQPIERNTPILWDVSTMHERLPTYTYKSLIDRGQTYRLVLISLHIFGFVILRGVPLSENMVEKIAAKIGLIQDTLYGRTWDVISKPNAENVAYTSSFLGLHQDLLYMSNVPRIQLLHCLENTCSGGESLFSDGYRAVDRFHRLHPGLVEPLRQRQLVYHYNKGPNSLRQSRPVLGDSGFWWSPPFQSPVQPDNLMSNNIEGYSKWHMAAVAFQRVLEGPDSVYEYKMAPGDLVIFDNRRVTHGRRAFDTASGERWLKGAYVDNDSYSSRIRAWGIGEPDAALNNLLAAHRTLDNP
ncbi:Clavaminate synthase-like protein [Nemania abortiva]|nr:Clavaminate synthase-like protein [Nemania abortiva]